MEGVVVYGLMDILETDGVDGVIQHIHARGGHVQGQVDLIWERATPTEALQYALTLLQLGREVEAGELIEVVAAHSIGAPLIAQGSQRMAGQLLEA